MKMRDCRKGFSLVEVIIALAIFGILIGGLLSFLPWGVSGVAKIRDRSIAMSLIDATQLELERLGFSLVESGTYRLDGLYQPTGEPIDAATINQIILVAPRTGGGVYFEQVIQRNQSSDTEGVMLVDEEGDPDSLPLATKDTGGKVYFDKRDGSGDPISLKGMADYASQNFESEAMNRWIDEKDRYFVLVCSQYSSLSRHKHNISNGYLALNVEVQWPYKIFAPGNSPPNDFVETEARYRSKFRFPIAIAR